MKLTQFETRERAEQMIRQATDLWQRSPQSEHLEELGSDPVFTLLMTALAYQSSELDGEIERFRQEVIEEMTRMLIPYELTHARPATTVVEALPASGIPEAEVSASTPFVLTGTQHTFIPLFRSKIIGAQLKSLQRIDGRRWKVSLTFNAPIDNLSGWCFAIRNVAYQDLRLSVGGKQLPLTAPEDYAQLPVDPAFGADTMLYNNLHAHLAGTACLDMYAQHDIRMYFVQPHADGLLYPVGQDKIDLVLEFTGVNETFAFSKADLVLNSVMLVNAGMHTATLSPSSPIVRVVGTGSGSDSAGQFMHLVCPSEDQLYGDSTIELRYAVADRFNQGALLRLLAALHAKYHTDYRAFLPIDGTTNDDTAQQLQQLLERLQAMARNGKANPVPGVYMLLRNSRMDKQGSVDIRYLTTAGAAVNSSLTADSTFTAPRGLDGMECRQVTEPVPGRDQLTDYVSGMETARYLVATGDRIVTPADIRSFCYKELLTRYGIARDMVQSINVSHRSSHDSQGCGYEIVADIRLMSNALVQRTVADKISSVEHLLQKMMEVRSTNIYPICVTIAVTDTK